MFFLLLTKHCCCDSIKREQLWSLPAHSSSSVEFKMSLCTGARSRTCRSLFPPQLHREKDGLRDHLPYETLDQFPVCPIHHRQLSRGSHRDVSTKAFSYRGARLYNHWKKLNVEIITIHSSYLEKGRVLVSPHERTWAWLTFWLLSFCGFYFNVWQLPTWFS